MTEQQAPPGWYPNAQGFTQWWDGTAWGPYPPQQQLQQPTQQPAQQPAQQQVQQQVQQPAQQQVQQQVQQPTQQSRASAEAGATKRRISGFVWGALALAALALALEVLALLPIFGVGWEFVPDADGNQPMGGMTQTLPSVPLWIPAVVALAGVAMAILGLRQSTKRGPAICALVLCGFAVVAPVIGPPILVLIGILLYATAGIGSQLSGGPTLG